MGDFPLPVKIAIFVMLALALVKICFFARFLYRWWTAGKPENVGQDDPRL